MKQLIGGIRAAAFWISMTESIVFYGKKKGYPATNGRLYSSG